MKRLLPAVGFMAVAVLLLWPALYNGGPFFFSDTTAYVRGADAGMQKLTGISTSWSAQPEVSTASAGAPPSHAAGSVSSIKDKTILSGRSVYYGALLYLGHQTGGFWLSIVLQSVAMTACLWLALRALGLAAWPRMLLIVAAVVVLTPAPFFVSFLMPDIFAGLTLLACAVLLTGDASMGRPELAFWVLLLTLALTFHTTHVLLAAVLWAAGGFLYAWRRRAHSRRAASVNGRGLAAIGASLVLAYVAGAAFSAAVSRIVGEPPLSPPFLMARLIDDGPGYDYLRATCPQNGFTVCRFMDRLPAQSDFFLWSNDPVHGVFAAADPTTRRQLSHEQFRFAVAVFEHDPWSEIRVSLRNALKQLSLTGLSEFDYDAQERETLTAKVPADHLGRVMQSAAYRGTKPTEGSSIAAYASSALGLVCILYLLVTARRRPHIPPGAAWTPAAESTARARLFTALILLGLLANTAVCGMLSGPHDRYEARVVWLLPAVALILAFARYRDSWDRWLGIRRAPAPRPPPA